MTKEKCKSTTDCRTQFVEVPRIFFEEGKPYSSSTYYSKSTLVPVYMFKDGKKLFVINYVLSSTDNILGKKATEAVKEAKDFLLANNGTYFMLHGKHTNPFDMLIEVSEKGYTFTEPDSMFVDCRNSGGFVDFHGNNNEATNSFHYRVYDMEYMKKLYEAVMLCIQKK